MFLLPICYHSFSALINGGKSLHFLPVTLSIYLSPQRGVDSMSLLTAHPKSVSESRAISAADGKVFRICILILAMFNVCPPDNLGQTSF